MSIKETIRQEIERLFNEYKPVVAGVDELTGAHIILAKLSAFIDSLPEEKCKDSLQVHETCKENTDSFTCLKDELALTWEDMAKIDAIILDVNNGFAVDYSKEIDRQKFYEEVLRRFRR